MLKPMYEKHIARLQERKGKSAASHSVIMQHLYAEARCVLIYFPSLYRYTNMTLPSKWDNSIPISSDSSEEEEGVDEVDTDQARELLEIDIPDEIEDDDEYDVAGREGVDDDVEDADMLA